MVSEEVKLNRYERINAICGWDLSVIGDIIQLKTSNFKQSILDIIYSDDGENLVLEIEEKAPAIIMKNGGTIELNRMIENGKKAKKCCDDVLAYISGVNASRNLSSEQIMQMSQTFSSIETVLNKGMPTTAKAMIVNLVPDENLITQNMKDSAIAIISSHGF